MKSLAVKQSLAVMPMRSCSQALSYRVAIFAERYPCQCALRERGCVRSSSSKSTLLSMRNLIENRRYRKRKQNWGGSTHAPSLLLLRFSIADMEHRYVGSCLCVTQASCRPAGVNCFLLREAFGRGFLGPVHNFLMQPEPLLIDEFGLAALPDIPCLQGVSI